MLIYKNKYNKKEIISFFLLFSWLAARTIILNYRSDLTALVNSGLSTQNRLQLLLTFLVMLWSLLLLLNRDVIIAQVWRKSLKWCLMLFSLFLLSAIWSVWPIFTLLRALELIAFFVLLIYLFSIRAWHVQLKIFLIGFILITWLGGLITPGANLLHLKIFGGLRSNVGGLIAAILLLINLYKIIFLKSLIRLVDFIYPVFSIIVFGSLSAIIAFIISLLIMLLLKFHYKIRPILIIIVLSLLVYFYLINDVKYFYASLANLSGKTVEHISTMTGRLPLWESIFKMVHNHPFGLGFAAAERRLSLNFLLLKRVHWAASNAHSGYLSTLLGVGWIGLIILFYLFYSIWRNNYKLRSNYSVFNISVLILLIINNFTVAGVGSQFNPVWVVFIALLISTVENGQHLNLERINIRTNNIITNEK